MDTTIRNLDKQAYREARVRAVLEGRTVGDVVNDALRSYLRRTVPKGKRSLAELHPEPFPKGNERLSREIDGIVYGSRA
jgi:plasmid stability protein